MGKFIPQAYVCHKIVNYFFCFFDLMPSCAREFVKIRDFVCPYLNFMGLFDDEEWKV